MGFIAVAEIIFVVIFNFSSFVIALLCTPRGYTYLGSVHYPSDYFYYLSFLAQGRERWLTAFHLQTSETREPVFLNWFFVLTGRIFHLLGINQIFAYQILVGLATAFFLTMAWLVLCRIFLNQRTVTVIAFTLFLFSDAFPVLKWSPLRFGYSSWYDFGSVWSRLVNTPHHPTIVGLVLLMFLLTANWFGQNLSRQPRIILLLGLILTSFILAAMQPLQWILTIGVILLFSFRIPINLGNFFPGFLTAVSGLAPAIYLVRLYDRSPFDQTKIWEAAVWPAQSLLGFIQINGPVMLLALMGLAFFLRIRNATARLLLIFVLVALGLYASPLPRWFAVAPVRFLSPVLTLFFAASAAVAIKALSQLNRKYQAVIRWSLVILIIAIMLPGSWHFYRKRNESQVGNSFYYVSNSALRIFAVARQTLTPEQTTLVVWPFNESFPALTGRRTFSAHFLSTIDFAKKDHLAAQFFDGKMSPVEMNNFLQDYKITHIIAYSWMSQIASLSLTKLAGNDYLVFYRVN